MVANLLLTVKVMALAIAHNRRSNRSRGRHAIQIRYKSRIELLRVRTRLVEGGLGDGVVPFEEGEYDDIVFLDAGEVRWVVGEFAGAAHDYVVEFGVFEVRGIGGPIGGGPGREPGVGGGDGIVVEAAGVPLLFEVFGPVFTGIAGSGGGDDGEEGGEEEDGELHGEDGTGRWSSDV